MTTTTPMMASSNAMAPTVNASDTRVSLTKPRFSSSS
jgi:hypothetical protein